MRSRRRSLAILCVASLGATGTACEADPTPLHDPPPVDAAAWSSALAHMDERPVRVVVVADSIGELNCGWSAVWQEFHAEVTDEPLGLWWAPDRYVGLLHWTPRSGTSVEAGLELRGKELTAGDAPTGSEAPIPVPTTLDLYYTARPGGSLLEVRIDGEVVDVVDTSRDELGRPVHDDAVVSQRWRSPVLGGTHTWSVSAVGPGSAVLEAASLPPSKGIELHGSGHAGASTTGLLERGYAIGHIEAMTARGEPPDLVLWGADTSDSRDRAVQARGLIEAIQATRAAAPGVTVAHYIPTGHGGRADWHEWAEMYRAIDEATGVVVLDGHRGVGDVSRGVGDHLSYDGVHLTNEGNDALSAVVYEALQAVR